MEVIIKVDLMQEPHLREPVSALMNGTCPSSSEVPNFNDFVPKSSYVELEAEKDKLEEENKNLEEQLRISNNNNGKLESEKRGLEGRISMMYPKEAYEALQNRCQGLESKLKHFDIMSLYNSLSFEVKENSSHLFKGDNNASMLYNLLQGNCPTNFYEVVKAKVLNQKTDSLEELKAILEIVFDYYASGRGIEIIKPSIGDSSNGNLHTVKFSDLDEGIISELMLFGYKDEKGKVAQKAIVKVR